MNCNRIIAAALAVCLIPAIGGISAYPAIIEAAAADGDAAASDTVVLECVGDKAPLTIGGTTEIPTWYSDNEQVATVTVTGDMTVDINAVGKGNASVFAVFSNQILRFDVTVLRESTDEKIIRNVGTLTLTNEQSAASADLGGVNNSDALWESSDINVATVNSEGNITAVGKGECTVTAEYGNYIYVISIISEYDPEHTEVPEETCVGEMKLSDAEPAQKINFTIPDGTSIKFSSTDESIAEVSADGVVTAKGSGSCRINIEVGSQKSYVSVVSTYTGKISEGSELGSITLNASAQSKKINLSNVPEDAVITWESSDTSVAVVDPYGVIIAVGAGNCTVIADVGSVKYSVNVTVDVSEASELPVTEIKGIGKTIELQGVSSDARCSSSNENAAVVDKNGVITSVGEGFAVITVDSDDSVLYLRVNVVKTGIVGDANCDGVISIADSTAILQHLGNTDKYGLSPTGLINADVDGNDGITGMDAVVLQMFDAKLINSLPYNLKL